MQNAIPDVILAITRNFFNTRIEGITFEDFMSMVHGDQPAPTALVDGLASMGITGFPNVTKEPRVRVHGVAEQRPRTTTDGRRSQPHRGKRTQTANPLLDAYALESYGSMGALADAIGVKRTTLSAWAWGRNRCPVHIRDQIHMLSGGRVTLASWDDASAIFRRSMR